MCSVFTVANISTSLEAPELMKICWWCFRAHQNLLLMCQSSSKSADGVSELIKIYWWCQRSCKSADGVSELIQICWWCVSELMKTADGVAGLMKICWWCGRAHENLLIVYRWLTDPVCLHGLLGVVGGDDDGGGQPLLVYTQPTTNSIRQSFSQASVEEPELRYFIWSPNQHFLVGSGSSNFWQKNSF